MAINEGSSGDGENLVPNLAANIGGAGDFDASRLDRSFDGALNENLIGGQRALDLGSLAHLDSPLKKASLTGFHATAKHIAAKAVSPSSETMRTI